MKKLRIFETFSGIGAQTKALSNIKNIDFENVGISEWYIDAIIAYAKTHHNKEFFKLKQELEKNNISKKDIISEYENNPHYVFSSNSKTASKLTSIKELKIKELYVANKVSNNFGSIAEIKGKDLPQNIDIFTYSFPCQSISLQGKQGGLSQDSETTSSLVWQVLRLLKEAKEHNNQPKVLLMENVKSLFSKKFIDTWNEIKEILSDFGYNTYDTTINAIDKGSVQRRERVFAVSILKKLDTGFEYNNSDKKKNKKMFKDILEDTIPENFIANNLKKHIENEKMEMRPSGVEYLVLKNYTTFQSENILYSIEGKSPTLTASGANSRLKMIDKNGDLRYILPIEAWQLMGFEKKDFEPNKELSKATLLRLAGNSISVEAIQDIFEDIISQVFNK